MAWVVGREAVLEVPTIGEGRFDFFGRVLPFPWATGAARQQMELVVGDRVVARVELAPRWQNVRLPLPDDFPTGRLEELRLRFAHALRPSDLGDAPDRRPLAAGFTLVAVVPRAVHDPQLFLEASSFDATTGRARVPVNGRLAVLLPASSRLLLRVEALPSACRSCVVTLALQPPAGSPRDLWSGSVAEARHLARELATPRGGPFRLLMGVSAADEVDEDAVVSFILGPSAVTARPPPARRGPPDVFVYMVDTLRADALAPWGGDPRVAPRMNAFASEAAVFLRSRAASTWTLPSVASLLTGDYADRHGVMRGDTVLDAGRTPPLATRLAARGYRTLAISHSPIVGRTFGFDSGFQSFFPSEYLNVPQLRSEEAVRLLAAWLSQWDESSPLFAYVHTVDPHAPYSPSDASEVRGNESTLPPGDFVPRVFVARGHDRDPALVSRMRSLYLGEVGDADVQFGRFLDLLKWLGLYENSLVVLVGDHGEEFGEHGGFEHGRTLFGETLRVPLVIRFPGGRWGGESVSAPVSLVDVAPTVLSAAGALDADAELDGEVLAPGPPSRARSRGAVLFEVAPARGHSRPDGDVALRGLGLDELKCVENLKGVDRFGRKAPPLEAFDLSVDAGERHPRTSGEEARECRSLFEWWRGEREGKDRRPGSAVSPEALEKLRALGYLN